LQQTNLCARGDPVTGDYDLWLVAIHHESDLLWPVSLETMDKFVERNGHQVNGGKSFSSDFENLLVNPEFSSSETNLNNFLNRLKFPVFQVVAFYPS
jgi:hypothetical protein